MMIAKRSIGFRAATALFFVKSSNILLCLRGHSPAGSLCTMKYSHSTDKGNRDPNSNNYPLPGIVVLTTPLFGRRFIRIRIQPFGSDDILIIQRKGLSDIDRAPTFQWHARHTYKVNAIAVDTPLREIVTKMSQTLALHSSIRMNDDILRHNLFGSEGRPPMMKAFVFELFESSSPWRYKKGKAADAVEKCCLNIWMKAPKEINFRSS